VSWVVNFVGRLGYAVVRFAEEWKMGDLGAFTEWFPLYILRLELAEVNPWFCEEFGRAMITRGVIGSGCSLLLQRTIEPQFSCTLSV
jgi:hypothetical protein